MESIKKALGNAPVFVIGYIIFMLPTYLLPYLGSNSAANIAIQHAVPIGTNALMWFHLGSLMVLIVLTGFRGSLVEKKWLVIFPILATVFDFVPVLSWIPMIPTVMHLLAIILGVVGAKAIERSIEATPQTTMPSPTMPMVGAGLSVSIQNRMSEIFCTECGQKNSESAAFCTGCGHKLLGD
jgi:hypothetical protein